MMGDMYYYCIEIFCGRYCGFVSMLWGFKWGDIVLLSVFEIEIIL